MPAVVRVLCGPAGSGKTGRLLDLFRQHTRTVPGSTLWLGPTPRAVEAVRTRLLQDANALVAPCLHAFSGFFDEIIRYNDPGIRSLSSVQQRLLAEEIAERLRKDGRLSYFAAVLDTRGFTEGLLQLLAELKRQQISARDLVRAIRKRRHEGTLDGQQPVQGRRTPPKERDCARLFAHYERDLQRLRLLDLEGRPAHALTLLERGLWRPFGTVRVVLVDGFTDFTESQYRALQLLAGRTEEVWITLPDEQDNVREELFTGPRTARERLKGLLQGTVTWMERSGLSPLSLERREKPGLAQLERQLFRPARALQPSDNADGISCLQAPGTLGEARLVARRIKTLLLQGVAADQIVVSLREVSPHADLLQEVFEEYGLPLDVEGSCPLTHNPAVAVLLRAVRLPEDDWSFAAVTALLRNTYFRPAWPQTGNCPEIAQHAEALLRLLGEPRDRTAYLRAVQRWAEQQQPGLEDEQAEESRRRRIHELAQLCQPFLQRFFQAWDHAPSLAPLGEHVSWLRNLIDDLGITAAAEEDARDKTALARFWEELETWQRRSGPLRLERKAFHHRLGAVAAAAGLPRTPRGPGRIRVLSAESARHLDVDHLFVMGLGERSFPRLNPPQALLDDHERQSFKHAGVELPGTADPLPYEMLLFYQLVTRARHSLTLSYAAVDERGQGLLPSSFLTAVLDCFAPGAVPVESRQMLIERYDRDMPLSPPEYRVRLAAAGPDILACARDLPAPLRANLCAAAGLIAHRFHDRQHNAYDGRLRDPAILSELAQRFGPQRVLSPTALEEYITCPFRFFLGNVLRLQPLDEPREEIEVTRRGQAFHRALARLHRRLKEQNVHQPDESIDPLMANEIAFAVEEDVRRAPSPAAKQLWQLEGERLLRLAARYRDHWQKFVEPWQENGIGPRPHLFEVNFGLPPEDDTTIPHGPLIIRTDSFEVRISGRIDRVDLAELPDGSVGFWIIDYKTGRTASYTGTALAEFRRLQLTLYALAVQEVLLAGRQSRPLGLAYWLVADTGPKVVLPARKETLWLAETERWRQVRAKLEGLIIELIQHVRSGEFPLQPRDEHCTQTCDFGQICRIAQARSVAKEWTFALPVISSSNLGNEGSVP
jgi:ATP-dependent helicase/nuclease subunit B